jgi:hypothetical protein
MRQAYRNATSDAKRREIAEGYEAATGSPTLTSAGTLPGTPRRPGRRVAAAPRPAAPVLDEDAEHECAGTTEDS